MAGRPACPAKCSEAPPMPWRSQATHAMVQPSAPIFQQKKPCLAAAGLQVGAKRVHHPQRAQGVHFKLRWRDGAGVGGQVTLRSVEGRGMVGQLTCTAAARSTCRAHPTAVARCTAAAQKHGAAPAPQLPLACDRIAAVSSSASECTPRRTAAAHSALQPLPLSHCQMHGSSPKARCSPRPTAAACLRPNRRGVQLRKRVHSQDTGIGDQQPHRHTRQRRLRSRSVVGGVSTARQVRVGPRRRQCNARKGLAR